MIALLINDTWKLRFKKFQKLCCIFRRQCYVAEDCVNPPDDSVINVCVCCSLCLPKATSCHQAL